jgi:hypothetical protein
MTALTVFLQDRQHVFIEGDRFQRNRGGEAIGGYCRDSRKGNREDKTKHGDSFISQSRTMESVPCAPIHMSPEIPLGLDPIRHLYTCGLCK